MSQALEEYLDRVLGYAKRNETDSQKIRAELKDHLLKKIEEFESQGAKHEEAVSQAIQGHGHPKTLGYSLRNFRSRLRKVGVVGTAILMGLLLAFLAWPKSGTPFDMRNVFSYVFSGRLFAFQWDITSPNYPFDHPLPSWGYVFFAEVAVIVLSYVALVRKMSARRTRLEYWTFVIPTAFVCLFLICMVTIPFCYTIKWMDAAGRGPGEMVVGLGGYIIVLGFFFWAIRPPKRKDELKNPSTPDTQSGAQL